MARATGIGGVFFKVADPAATRAWYAEHLGLPTDDYNAIFPPDGDALAQTVWAPFPADSDYFGPGGQSFMINFRVDDLDVLLAELAAKGVPCAANPLDDINGKYGWIIDCDGRRIELWQPRAV